MTDQKIQQIDVFHDEPDTSEIGSLNSSDSYRFRFVARLDLDAMSVAASANHESETISVLELAYRLTNSVDAPWWEKPAPGFAPVRARHRPSSAGDVFRVRMASGLEQFWIVSGVGFRELVPSEIAHIWFSADAPRQEPRYFTVSLDVEVTDAAKILTAARAKLENDVPAEDLADMTLAEALRYLFDPSESPPGCIIQDSRSEEHAVF